MKKYFWIFLAVLLPILEVAVFIFIHKLIGTTLTLVIVFVSAIFGVKMWKSSLKLAQENAIKLEKEYGRPKNAPTDVILITGTDLMFSMISSMCFLSPGFLSDIFGLFLAVPKVRKFIGEAQVFSLRRQAAEKGMSLEAFCRKKEIK